MTLKSDVLGDERYTGLLDHGFVGLVDIMGDDAAIVNAARVSYGDGTKSVREDRGLIRYLVRHKHTSPLEMVEVKLHLKIPIFVMRQLVRHRTSSLNEYSGRYSVLTDEFYVPELDNILPQSTTNKQGRSGTISESDAQHAQHLIKSATEDSFRSYNRLLGEEPYTGMSEDFPGISREIARTVMPVAGYTELYWKQNLHNLFHMLKLREDSHAQWEIQELARAIYRLIKPALPLACEAYEDYIRDSKTISGMEVSLLKDVIAKTSETSVSFATALNLIITSFANEADFLDHYRLSKRELTEFKSTLGL